MNRSKALSKANTLSRKNYSKLTESPIKVFSEKIAEVDEFELFKGLSNKSEIYIHNNQTDKTYKAE